MKVLIVDDHPLIRDGLMLLLPTLDPNLKPHCASSCEEALLLLEKIHDISLVLLDLGLPGMSGVEPITTLRSRYPSIPIVALSAMQDRETIFASIRSGAMGFIPKSYSSDRLLGALQYVLIHKGTFLPAEVILEQNTFDVASERQTKALECTSLENNVDPRSLGLTDRQADVLYLVLQGKQNKVIARELNIEETTVRSHVTAVLRSLKVNTRTEAVVAAHKIKLVFSARQD